MEHNGIEIFGDEMSPQGLPVDYAEIEVIIGFTGLSASAVKANDGKFRTAISLAVTGDVSRAKDIVVTKVEDVETFLPGVPDDAATGAAGGDTVQEEIEDEDNQRSAATALLLELFGVDAPPTQKSEDGPKRCRVSFTMRIKQANASRAAITYARVLSEGAVRLQEAMNAYKFLPSGGAIQPRVLVEPRVLAGNTASDAAIKRQELEQRTNAEQFRAGEQTAEALAEHKYSNYRPHNNDAVQRLYRMKQKCRDSDCVLRIDQKLNEVMADHDHTKSVADEISAPEVNTKADFKSADSPLLRGGGTDGSAGR
jgi:hypothetical protein